MPAPTTIDQFLDLLPRSGLVQEDKLKAYLDKLRTAKALPEAPAQLAQSMVRDGLLTRFQADQLLQGKSKGYTIAGKYRLLEHLGSGGMGSVYLCEHTALRRRVAIKVLPIARAKEASYLERFYREARAVAALDHPNIVRAHDVDHDGKLHFLVMEFVDGASLQEIVSRHGPLDPVRAAHYLAQAALGLQHAFEAGLIHRDIKPANVLIDRGGTVKILDLGLSRFFHDDDNLSKRFDETVLGTSDYLAPEQTLDSNVDVRADIYSLGATFYYCLTGETLFGKGGTPAQKLIWHQIRQPRPIRSLRSAVPAELAEVIEQKMLAKDPAKRFQQPHEIFEALAPWTEAPIPPPPAQEMPQLSPAATRADGRTGPSTPTPPGRSPAPSKPWKVSGTDVVRAAAKHPGAADPEDSRPTSIRTGSGRDSAAAGSSRATRPAAPATRSRRWPLWAALALLLLLAGGAGGWWAYNNLPEEESPPRQERQLARQQTKPHDEENSTKKGVRPAVRDKTAVAVEALGDTRVVRTPTYQAVVGADGNLSSLRVGGVEWLKTGLPFERHVSRGSYFFFTQENGPGVVKLPTLELPAANVLKASGDRFAVEYDFHPDSIKLKATNATDHEVPFFLVFDPAILAVFSPQGELALTPATREWPTTSWLVGRSKVTITGGNRIWGPFVDGTQVWQASVKTYETRNVALTFAPASAAESNQAAEALASAGKIRVRKPAYDAVVEADGCLTSLRAYGTEFLKPGVDISRGMYFHDGKFTLHLGEVQAKGDVIAARGPKAAIRYNFGNDAITCTATNTSDGDLAFFAVFDHTVLAVQNKAGEWAKVVTQSQAADEPAKKWEVSTWFAAGAKLQMTGGTRVWGPWPGPGGYQVWHAVLKPKEEKQVVLRPGRPTAAEADKVAQLVGRPVARTDLSLDSPLDYQVFQRHSRAEGMVRLRGRVWVGCDKLEARLAGKSLDGALPGQWQPVPRDEKSGGFDVTLPTRAGGWYKVEVRALQGEKAVAQTEVAHVGVGEIFVGAGQSNSTNCGPEKLQTETKMASTFDGSRWRLADDPQPGVHDNSGGGSYWPAFGDALYEKYKVPIGIASVGHSGTSVNQWQPGGELFQWLVTRVRELGPHGFRAVLWHQGESDVGMSSDDYARKMTALIRGSQRAAGWEYPWMVAQVSYHNPKQASFPTTRAGQKKLWDEGVALEGPDTDRLTGDNRSEGGQGIHFSAKGLRAHGRMWAEKVSVYLDRVLR
jgi:serine/threonine protein kinase